MKKKKEKKMEREAASHPAQCKHLIRYWTQMQKRYAKAQTTFQNHCLYFKDRRC